ncbi:MAG: 2-amino-4-hydroxy-6-hydroxymethyldihydropteridine diphosphokinase [Actinobacteria bacterium]|uniref:2-amino-4-hydroxy-6-hydroxymethyldihydropteridine diphosphokinase n=1 Tax=freshwater metagenome TaxID=449393 RepID=A0A6J7S0R0_9ZZZZ|nr:2-amino-4-hydroxy-6-hydroxymethyldihydropteridine diphosphokinase [Actinomycetota bacterium]MTB27188.1 2-amino-4-hydroxy-6-hydroxymethyldihydropteridine diphosphokinase [Actinomycetota bacterium]
MTFAVIALGANLGDATSALQGAVDALVATAGVTVVSASPVFETDPVGGPDQPVYVNAVVLLETELEPLALLRRLNEIEEQWQRTREVRWGPRTLDLDIIDIDGFTSDTEQLTVPHPRAHLRGFVLVPWLAVDADAILGGSAVAEVVRTVDVTGVRKLNPELRLAIPS